MRILNRLGGHRALERLHLHQGDQQEKAADDRQVSARSSSPARSSKGLTKRRGRRAVRHDREIRRLRLQQEPFDRLRADRLHDGLSQGPLSGRVHGGLALRRHSRRRNFKKKDSLVEHLEDCRRMDIEVVPPDVNRSRRRLSRRADGKIHFGLAAIKGCGGKRPRRSSRPSDRQGPFRNLFDFCERVDPAIVNRTAIESLVKAGALDSLGARRSQWMARRRTRRASRRRGARRPALRPEGAVRRFWRRRAAGFGRRSARHPGVERSRSAGRREGSAGLLSHQPSAGRARRDAAHSTARTPRSKPRRSRTAPK